MNYAYSQPSSQPFNVSPFTQQMAGLSPVQQGYFNFDPNVAYEQFIRSINPSMTQTDMLRRMFSSLQDQFNAKTAMNFGQGTPQTFTDFLSKYNFGHEFANQTPQTRKENPQAFTRPVRVVTF